MNKKEFWITVINIVSMVLSMLGSYLANGGMSPL